MIITIQEAIDEIRCDMCIRHGRIMTDDFYEALNIVIDALTAQAETHEKRTETHSCDCVERAAAIEAEGDKWI